MENGEIVKNSAVLNQANFQKNEALSNTLYKGENDYNCTTEWEQEIVHRYRGKRVNQ